MPRKSMSIVGEVEVPKQASANEEESLETLLEQKQIKELELNEAENRIKEALDARWTELEAGLAAYNVNAGTSWVFASSARKKQGRPRGSRNKPVEPVANETAWEKGEGE